MGVKKIIIFNIFFVMLFSGITFAKKTTEKEKILQTLAFENLKYWKKAELLSETKLVKEGKQAALWKDTEDNARPNTKRIPHNLSKYKAMSIWIYSKVANNAKIAVILGSENDETSGGDYYMTRILINWTGWKKIVIPFNTFEIVRTPVGFNKIDRLRFAATGYKTGGAKDDTELILDGIKFLTGDELKKEKKNIYKGFSKKRKKKVKNIKEVWSE